jgi:hypothetical protein
MQLAQGCDMPAIITVRIEGRSGRHVIVDGNHRAVAHAYLKLPIRYFEIRSDADIDTIVQVEARGGFAAFPHRSFLTQRISYKQLVHDAVVAASQVMETCSVQDKAEQIVADEGGRHSIHVENRWDRKSDSGQSSPNVLTEK